MLGRRGFLQSVLAAPVSAVTVGRVQWPVWRRPSPTAVFELLARNIKAIRESLIRQLNSAMYQDGAA